MPANALSTLRGSSGLLAARRPAIGPSLAAPPLGHRHLSVPLPPRRARPVTTAALGQKTPLRQEAEISTETLPGLMAIAAAAVHALANRFAGSAPALQHAQLSPGLIYSALSWYTLIAGVLHTVAQARQEGPSSWDAIGNFVGPMHLAVQSLGGIPRLHLSPWETAVALFGTLMARRLPTGGVPYASWGWLATLAAAIYKGLGTQWVVAAFGLAAGWRLFQGLRDGRISLPDLALSAFAAAGAFMGAWEITALAIMAGQIAASVVS